MDTLTAPRCDEAPADSSGDRLHHGPGPTSPLAHATVNVSHVGIATLSQRVHHRPRSVLRVADQQHGHGGVRRDLCGAGAQLPHGQQPCAWGYPGGVLVGLSDVDQDGFPRLMIRARPIERHGSALGSVRFGCDVGTVGSRAGNRTILRRRHAQDRR